MRSSVRIDAVRRWLLLGAAVLLIAGCSTPPSVMPLLDITSGVLRDEAARLKGDAESAQRRLDAERASLAAAFERDLEQRDALDTDWVADAVSVYVAARDALTRHGHDLAEAYAARIDNLAAAREANRRARTLLEHHVNAWPWPEAIDGWRLRDVVLSTATSTPLALPGDDR